MRSAIAIILGPAVATAHMGVLVYKNWRTSGPFAGWRLPDGYDFRVPCARHEPPLMPCDVPMQRECSCNHARVSCPAERGKWP
jgi:hypothetical protein